MSNRKLPVQKVLGLALVATGASVINGIVSAGGAPMAGVALGITGFLGGIFGNYFAGLTQRAIDDGATSPESLILNHDLRRLTGEAIGDVIGLGTGPDAHERLLIPEAEHAAVAQLQAAAIEAWMSESIAADGRFEGLSEQQLAAEFATSEVEFKHHRALDVDSWLVFLEALSSTVEPPPSQATLQTLAIMLHERLPQMLRGKVKQDFEGDTETGGRGFASLHLMLMGKLLEGVKTLLDRPAEQSSQQAELLEQLKQLSAQAGLKVTQHERRLTPKDRAALSGVIQQLNTLRPFIDSRIDRLLHSIGTLDVKVTHQHKATSHRLRWIGAGVGVALLIGIVGWMVLVWNQQDARRLTAEGTDATRRVLGDLVGRLDESEKLIRQFLSERPLDSRGQPIIPQLTGELKQRAEELIGKGNKRQRLVAAVAMNDFTTADRLQAEIRDQIKSEREAEDYELAVLEGDRWYRANEYDKAIAPYEDALKLRGDDPVIRNYVADVHILARLGNIEAHCKRAIELCEGTLELVEPTSTLWAEAQRYLGRSWLALPTGVRTDNLTKSITASRAALTVYTRHDHPAEWAHVQNTLGNALASLPTGDRSENIAKSLAAYESAMEVFNKQERPFDWAMIQVNQANALCDLPIGDRNNHLTRAIAAYESALEICRPQVHPVEWASIQNNLGLAWQSLPTGDRSENLAKAIKAFRAALEVRTKERFPVSYATTQTNLGIAMMILPTGDRAANLEKAIAAYESALEVYTRSAHPHEWAKVLNNLGIARMNLPTGDRQENLTKAIEAYQAAMEVRTKEDFPEGWAMAQINLGIAWQGLPGGNRAENASKAIAAFERALEVYTKEDHPVRWATTQHNIGALWGSMRNTDSAQSLANAMAAYTKALEVRTAKDFPVEWAGTHYNMAKVLAEMAFLPGADRCALLRRSIASSKGALTVFTPQAFPNEHANASKNLRMDRDAYEKEPCSNLMPYERIQPAK